MDESELEIVRRAYAKQIIAVEGVEDPRVEAAFAKVRREDFLGPGPWPVLRWAHRYVTTPSADPVYLYTDDAVGIVPERRLNNGVPSFHAKLIASASPQPGEHVVHVGAGVGYYTALFAELVGPSGAVTAIEFDPDLAARAAANFSKNPCVQVMQADGAQCPFKPADVIYINAGVTRPAASWLDGLNVRGRLILPLTTNQGFRRSSPDDVQRRGAVFRIERHSGEFLAQWISGVAIFPCEGARDAESQAALVEAFKVERWNEVTRLYRRDDLPPEECWLRAPGWCLAYR